MKIKPVFSLTHQDVSFLYVICPVHWVKGLKNDHKNITVSESICNSWRSNKLMLFLWITTVHKWQKADRIQRAWCQCFKCAIFYFGLIHLHVSNPSLLCRCFLESWMTSPKTAAENNTTTPAWEFYRMLVCTVIKYRML